MSLPPLDDQPATHWLKWGWKTNVPTLPLQTPGRTQSRVAGQRSNSTLPIRSSQYSAVHARLDGWKLNAWLQYRLVDEQWEQLGQPPLTGGAKTDWPISGKNNLEIVELGGWVNMTVSHNSPYKVEEIPGGNVEVPLGKQHQKSLAGMESDRTRRSVVMNLPETLQWKPSFLNLKLARPMQDYPPSYASCRV